MKKSKKLLVLSALAVLFAAGSSAFAAGLEGSVSVNGGSLSKDQVTDILEKNQASLNSCVDKFAAKQGAGLKLSLSFDIEAPKTTGKISSRVRVESNRVAGYSHRSLAKCLLGESKTWGFPAGSKAEFTYDIAR